MKIKYIIAFIVVILFAKLSKGQCFLNYINFGKDKELVSKILEEAKDTNTTITFFVPQEATHIELIDTTIPKIEGWYIISYELELLSLEKENLCNLLFHDHRQYERSWTRFSCEHIPEIGFIINNREGGIVYTTLSFRDETWVIQYRNKIVFRGMIHNNKFHDSYYRSNKIGDILV